MAIDATDPFEVHEVRELTGHKTKVFCVDWSNNGKRLASGAGDGSIKIWRLDPRHGRPERSETDLVGHTNSIAIVRWDPTTADRLASVSIDNTVKLWDARSSRCMGTVKVTARPLFIAWNADGSELLCLDQSDIISIISAKTFKVVRKHKYGSQVNEVLWSSDGKLMYLAIQGGAIEVLEYPSFQHVQTVIGHGQSAHVYHLRLDPSGRYLASSASDAVVSLWDTSDMVCVRTFTGFDDDAPEMSFSSDTQFLACIDKRQGITMLEVETGRVVHRISTGGFVPPTLEWNPRHPVLAWPAAPPLDYRGETMRDSEGGISVFAPL